MWLLMDYNYYVYLLGSYDKANCEKVTIILSNCKAAIMGVIISGL